MIPDRSSTSHGVSSSLKGSMQKYDPEPDVHITIIHSPFVLSYPRTRKLPSVPASEPAYPMVMKRGLFVSNIPASRIFWMVQNRPST